MAPAELTSFFGGHVMAGQRSTRLLDRVYSGQPGAHPPAPGSEEVDRAVSRLRQDIMTLLDGARIHDRCPAALAAALSELLARDPECYQVICQRYFGRYLRLQIAENLDLQEDDVKRKLNLGLRFLRFRLK